MMYLCYLISALLLSCSIVFLVSADSWSVYSPAGEDQVSGSTRLVNMQSCAMESKLKIRAVGEDGIPAGVEYLISIAPINGTDAAIGTVITDFRGKILEGRKAQVNTSEINQWRDHTMVSGAIVNYMKSFTHTSGITL